LFIVNKHDAQWRKGSLVRLTSPAAQRHWLFDPRSLTDKLVAHAAGDFKVSVLRQRIGRPLFSEARQLGLSHSHHALIREVALLGQGEPWVYARTVVPLSSLGGSLKQLRNLGNRSLGSALFADPTIRRGELHIAKIGADYLPTLALLQNSRPTWGRRSEFTFNHRSLLVTEVFLERLWNNKKPAQHSQ